jgi:hypothetical protein
MTPGVCAVPRNKCLIAAAHPGRMPRRSACDTPQGVYRTPGRMPEEAPPPPFPWHELLSPLGWAVAFLATVLVPPALFAWAAPGLLHTSREVRLVPAVEIAQDILAIVGLGSFALLGVLMARRFSRARGGVSRGRRIGYVAALLAVQSLAVLAGEAILFSSRGGLRLFEPKLVGTSQARDGRTAYLYRDCFFGCTYDVYVGAPWSLTATRALSVSRRSSSEPLPRLDWSHGTPRLLDSRGQPLERQSQTIGFPLFGAGGC